MGLFKKMTDPGPGGGITGDDPDAERRTVRDARDLVRLPGELQQADDSGQARIVDSTELIMGGVKAVGEITAISRATHEINLQPTFELTLNVHDAENDEHFAARVIQPVAEEYLAAAVAGAQVTLKYKPDDHGAVWVDWAASAAAGS